MFKFYLIFITLLNTIFTFMHKPLLFLLAFLISRPGMCQVQDDYFQNNSGNPVFSGHFADPSIVKIDDKYLIYATTVSDYFEPMVWVSEDLQTWLAEPLNILGEHRFWAPSVIEGKDGKVYLYYSSGFDFKCHLYIGETYKGPWEKFGLVEKGFDLQIFEDPVTGKVYGSSSNPQSRPRLVEFESNPEKEGYLTDVIKEASLEGPFFDYTEGSFIIYRNGYYYLMYSGGKCGAETYKVNYARSKNIWGPYEDAANNPVLKADPERKIFGPGHHSVIQVQGDYFIAYHRQDFYFYPTCSERQVCIDRMEFDENGWIKEITPTNQGVDFSSYLKPDTNYKNVAFAKNVAAGGIAKSFNPEFAVDNNYATYWQGNGYLSVDLGETFTIEKIIPRFIKYDYFNLYKILYSQNNQDWQTYVDFTEVAGKAYQDVPAKKVEARYVKIQFLRGEGYPPALAELEILSR